MSTNQTDSPVPAPKRKEVRGAIRVLPALEQRFKAARDAHKTTTPALLAALLDHFEGLSVANQGKLLRGESVK